MGEGKGGGRNDSVLTLNCRHGQKCENNSSSPPPAEERVRNLDFSVLLSLFSVAERNCSLIHVVGPEGRRGGRCAGPPVPGICLDRQLFL